ncbi:hypothetical protein [Fulvivirga ligni]|uniref:hypothetical protein n=1 Tax=Fulvivirga ligni TaxID=2904246 RepID=UPI001F2600D7|nr:hypothetical protein [Fulvivirga ligni]UII22209.1 hypothetical protein LVD16_03055 [Fulvivirga ligni]
MQKQIDGKLDASYIDLIQQVEEMIIYLQDAYVEDQRIQHEIDHWPGLVKNSWLTKDPKELIGFGAFGFLAPLMFISLIVLCLPAWIIYILTKWYLQNKAIERLRLTHALLSRVIFNMRLKYD